MNLNEAIVMCHKGNFMTHKNFDSNQSMHYYNGSLYYEDGANLDSHLRWMKQEESLQDGWSVKFTSEQVGSQTLSNMHFANRNYMLRSGSYEDCIIK